VKYAKPEVIAVAESLSVIQTSCGAKGETVSDSAHCGGSAKSTSAAYEADE